ncbi:MAG: esterase, partial [Thermotoga sp.]
YLSKEYWRYNWFKQIYEFYKLQKVSWRRLKYVESPTLVILSKKDGIVPISAGEMIMKNISSREKRMVILEKSGHVITRDVELDTVVNETVRWLEGDRLG